MSSISIRDRFVVIPYASGYAVFDRVSYRVAFGPSSQSLCCVKREQYTRSMMRSRDRNGQS